MLASTHRQERPMLAAIVLVTLVLAMMFWSGRFTAKQAAYKGRSERAWFVWGALLFPRFPLASIVLALLPARSKGMAG
jgi:hypothetical protein